MGYTSKDEQQFIDTIATVTPIIQGVIHSHRSGGGYDPQGEPGEVKTPDKGGTVNQLTNARKTLPVWHQIHALWRSKSGKEMSKMARYAMAIDLEYCIGCYNCQIACRDENVGNEYLPITKSQPTFGHFWMELLAASNQQFAETLSLISFAKSQSRESINVSLWMSTNRSPALIVYGFSIRCLNTYIFKAVS